MLFINPSLFFSEYKACILSSEKCCDLDDVLHDCLDKKTQHHFYSGVWIIAKNNLCDQQKFMILICFIHHDKLNN